MPVSVAMAIVSRSGSVSFSIAGAIAVKQFQDGVERRDVRQFGLRLDQGRNLLQAIHHLGIDRMLDPQRAVLIKRGNALLGGTNCGLP